MTAQSREPVVTTPAGSRTTRQLRPCGTESAYNRHRYRGEPIDDACAQAHREYQSQWAAAARARSVDLPPCTECDGPRKPRQGAYGWCSACYNRWLDAGRPAGGPPPPWAGRRARSMQRRDDYRWLIDSGEPASVAAQRIGITEKTARNWEAARRREVAA